LREKIVASSSRFVVCIADQSKAVDVLGKFPLPVEVSRFGVNATAMKLGALLRKLGYEGVQMRLRATVLDKPFFTDSGNPIIDLKLEKIKDPEALEAALNALPGVIDHGLFIGICGVVMLGTDKGVQEFTRPS
jgi:ribose 5-phosphate isomerase A